MSNPETRIAPIEISDEHVGPPPTLEEGETSYDPTVKPEGIEYDPAASENLIVPKLEDAQPVPAPRIEATPQDYAVNEETLEQLGPTNRTPDHVLESTPTTRVPVFESPEAAAERRREVNKQTSLGN
jgi:hypothetical protein